MHFIPEGGETCQSSWQAFLCLSGSFYMGGFAPPCRVLMHLLPCVNEKRAMGQAEPLLLLSKTTFLFSPVELNLFTI